MSSYTSGRGFARWGRQDNARGRSLLKRNVTVGLRALCFIVFLCVCCCLTDSQAATLGVNSTDDTIAIDGRCTLREAITSVNNGADFSDCAAVSGTYGSNDIIGFDIPASTDAGCNAATQVCTIKPALSLPFVTKRVTIDGYTQPWASANTNSGALYPNAQAINAAIKIELDGSLAGAGASGLVLNGMLSVVRGLAIVNFDPGSNGAGLIVNGQSSTVAGNFIGVRADGVTAGGNSYGLIISSFIQVGSYIQASNRNLVAGNDFDILSNFGSQGNQIVGNLIGTDASGTQSRSSGTCILDTGMSDAIRGNVIAGCISSGVDLRGARSTEIFENAIGIGVGGLPLGNGQYGIRITNDPSRTTQGNLIYSNGIAYNTLDGIRVETGAAGAPSGNNFSVDNSVFGNGQLGINLAPTQGDGVTPNDAAAALDADSGPNGLQNYPVVSSAAVNSSGGIDIAFTLDTAASGNFRIYAYANDYCDSSGNGEGRYPATGYFAAVFTDASGHASGSLNLSSPLPAGWTTGKYVSLLAHDVNANNTSEFSACMQVVTAGGCSIGPARRTTSGLNYTTVQAAYAAAATVMGSETIGLQAQTFTGDVDFTDAIDILLTGGWNCPYDSNALTYSTIQGRLTISNGSAVMENIIIM